eukprot:3419072-Ditylum_brightwellii.AAC.1
MAKPRGEYQYYFCAKHNTAYLHSLQASNRNNRKTKSRIQTTQTSIRDHFIGWDKLNSTTNPNANSSFTQSHNNGSVKDREKDTDSRFGDKIDTDISDSVFQVLGHNVNRINLGNQGEEFPEELTLLKDFGFDFLNLIETKNN